MRKETSEDWRAYLQRLAAAEGLELKTREELARFDQQRKKDGKKKASNDEWESKTDPDARIMKLKNGSTHLAPHSLRKTGAKNAIDLETGAILAAEITPGNRADSATVIDTLDVIDRLAIPRFVASSERQLEQTADGGWMWPSPP